jgi:hypothetical protein
MNAFRNRGECTQCHTHRYPLAYLLQALSSIKYMLDAKLYRSVYCLNPFKFVAPK